MVEIYTNENTRARFEKKWYRFNPILFVSVMDGFVLSVIRFLRTDVGSRSNRNRDFVSTSWSCDELLRLVFVLSSFFSAVLGDITAL